MTLGGASYALFARTGGGDPGPTLLSPRLRRQIAGAVASSSIDIWTGASDKLLRQISATIVFSFAHRPHHALTGGRIDVHLRLDDINRHRAPAGAFAAPTGGSPRPLARGRPTARPTS